MPKKRKKATGKRIKVDVWVGGGLRQAIGFIVRDDGKPANDAQVRLWCQEQTDLMCAKIVDQHARATGQ